MRKKGIDHQLKKALDSQTNSPISTVGNIQRMVWRTCMLMLGCKGYKKFHRISCCSNNYGHDDVCTAAVLQALFICLFFICLSVCPFFSYPLTSLIMVVSYRSGLEQFQSLALQTFILASELLGILVFQPSRWWEPQNHYTVCYNNMISLLHSLN